MFSKAPADLSKCGAPGEYVPSPGAPCHPIPTHTASQNPGGAGAALGEISQGVSQRCGLHTHRLLASGYFLFCPSVAPEMCVSWTMKNYTRS